MYLIIEICDREVCSTAKKPTIREAVDEANSLLKAHIDNLGYPDTYDEAEQEALSTGDMTQGDIHFASQDDPNAWCNLKAYDYDVFVIREPED